MATYKEIFGTNIEVLASDPANPVQGQVWYNSTSNVVKGQGATTVGAWATGTSINTARMTAPGTGSYTDMMIAGGITGPPLYNTFTNTELWNGSTWTETNDINTGRYNTGVAGTTTAALIYGGKYPPDGIFTNAVESWNGTSWTAGTSMNTARGDMGSAGQVYTDCMGFGGGPGPVGSNNEIWNGATWTEVNNLSTTHDTHPGGTGADTTAALCFGGGPPYKTNNETWNGTSWTATTAMNAGSGLLQTLGNSNTDCLGAGGGDNVVDFTAKTEQWNGTAWTEVADLPTATRQQSYGNNGTTGSGLSVGGQQSGVPGSIDTVYDWLGAGSPTTVTFTDS